MKQKVSRVSGYNVVYFDEGKGDCIVLLHGWLGGKVVYKPLVEELRKNFRVIVPDIFGYGDVWQKKRTLFHTQAEVILKLLDKLNIKNFHLFGNSLGGGLSTIIAESDPNRIKNLILRVPFVSFRQLPLPARNKMLRSTFRYIVSKSVVQNRLRILVRKLLVRELFPKDSCYLDFKNEVLNDLDQRADTRLSTAYITEAFYMDLEPILNSLQIPTTILETPKDKVLRKKYLSILKTSIVRKTIPGSQHGLLSSDQKILATYIQKALKN